MHPIAIIFQTRLIAFFMGLSCQARQRLLSILAWDLVYYMKSCEKVKNLRYRGRLDHEILTMSTGLEMRFLYIFVIKSHFSFPITGLESHDPNEH